MPRYRAEARAARRPGTVDGIRFRRRTVARRCACPHNKGRDQFPHGRLPSVVVRVTWRVELVQLIRESLKWRQCIEHQRDERFADLETHQLFPLFG